MPVRSGGPGAQDLTGLRVGCYVHHHGAGHRVRAQLLAGALRSRGAEVSLLGSGLTGERDVVLKRDDSPPVGALADVDARGALHWVPLHHKGLRDRMARIASWFDQARPEVMVVDVSVEVAMLARLHGIPVVVVAQPGDRSDGPHQLAFRIAAAVLAPWPDWADPAQGLDAAQGRVHRVGGLSQYADAPPRPGPVRDPRSGVILSGSEGFDDPDLVGRITGAQPDWRWTVLDGRIWVDDVGTLLRSAGVVVAHAGQNAIADIAACGAPAVVVPQRRPFAEQLATARLLADVGLVASVEDADQADWRELLHAAGARAGEAARAWSQWQTAGAVTRAADVVVGVARA